MSCAYAEVTAQLRIAYQSSAQQRDAATKSAWKLAEREKFLQQLQSERKARLIEIGAGTGQDSAFFRAQGLGVVATDLSPAMVACCRAKGLTAYEMDVLHLNLEPAAFDAGYAFNSLLHVPNASLAAALEAIDRVLADDALLYIGTYGGEDFEGVKTDDWHQPARFFSFRSDAELLRRVRHHFVVLDFRTVEDEGRRFQALTLRKAQR